MKEGVAIAILVAITFVSCNKKQKGEEGKDTGAYLDTDTEVDSESDTIIDTESTSETTETDTSTETESASDTDTDVVGLSLYFYEYMLNSMQCSGHRLLIGPGSSTTPDDTDWTVLAGGGPMCEEPEEVECEWLAQINKWMNL